MYVKFDKVVCVCVCVFSCMCVLLRLLGLCCQSLWVLDVQGMLGWSAGLEVTHRGSLQFHLASWLLSTFVNLPPPHDTCGPRLARLEDRVREDV